MKFRLLMSAAMTAGLLLTATAQAHDRDHYRGHDRRAEHYDRHDAYRGWHGDYRYQRYSPRYYGPHYYGPRYYGYRYYPRASYYYGYPYAPYGLTGSFTVTIPLN